VKGNDRLLLALVAIVLLLGLGAAAFLLLESPAASDTVRTTGVTVGVPETEGPGVGPEAEGPPGVETRTSSTPLIEVRLRLRVDPYDPAGSRDARERDRGRKGSLLGRVTQATGSPAPATRLAFTAGLNRGAEATTDPEGWYSLVDLHPGKGVLRIEAPGRLAVLREVVVPLEGEERSDFHLPGPIDVAGKVIDREGKGVAGAEVRIDDRPEFTDSEGIFRIAQVTPGDVLVLVRAEGYAPRRETLSLRSDALVAPSDVTILLETAAVLRGEVFGAPVEGGSAYLSLVPEKPPADRSFPFEAFGWIEITGNGAFRVPGIPIRKAFQVRAFHALAASDPPERFVYLTGEGDRNLAPVVFRLEPVRRIEGTVIDGETGSPLAGARVRLEPADFLAAVRSIHPGAGPALDVYVVDPPPVFRVEPVTDGRGRFLGGTGPVAGRRWIEVGADGYRTLERSVPPDSGEVPDLVLFLEETLAAGARLEIAFDPSPVEEVALTLNGSAKSPLLLEDGGPLVVPFLVPGIYELEVRRGARAIHRVERLLVGGRTRVKVPLP